MSNKEILEVLSGLLTDILGGDKIGLTMETRRDDVPAWDSFAYINFVVAVESTLGIKFRVADVESFETVGAMVSEIVRLKK